MKNCSFDLIAHQVPVTKFWLIKMAKKLVLSVVETSLVLCMLIGKMAFISISTGSLISNAEIGPEVTFYNQLLFINSIPRISANKIFAIWSKTDFPPDFL